MQTTGKQCLENFDGKEPDKKLNLYTSCSIEKEGKS
jgi:hypothetical protein